MLTDRQKEEVLELARRFIGIPSLTGEEAGVAAAVHEAMESLGYHEVHRDEWGNVVGVIRGSGPGSVLFDAHMDTVPWNAAAWKRDPLGGEVAQGRLWGRGASDMKGAMAAAVYGVGLLARDPGSIGTVYVSCSVCEEPAEGASLVRICQRFQPRAVVIQEATELRINIGQRGRAEIIVETLGKSAHSSRPDLGHNAVKDMASLIRAVEERLQLPSDPLLGPAILEVTDVKSYPYPGLSVVPSRCRATFDRRLLVEDTRDGVLDQVRQLAQELGIEAEVRLAETEIRTYTGTSFTHPSFAPAWKLPSDAPFVRAAQGALQSVGQAGELGAYSFCTNGSGSAGVLGIPTIGYGPGRESEAHIDDEWLELDQLYAATAGYGALARELSRLETV